jgi:hypothetical protein
MFLIGWFHLYLRSPGHRISENLKFFCGGGLEPAIADPGQTKERRFTNRR